MAERVICDLCGGAVPPHGHYVVKVSVYADPSMPGLTSDDLEETDFDQTFAELLKQMEGMSAEELQDQVHRAFEFRFCRACQQEFLANPLGKPRKRPEGQN